jgi:fluoroacetyl-CoA thioesterase
MEIGIKGSKTITVTEEMTAEKIGSGMLPVYASPCMMAEMENVASLSVQKELEEGNGTVGIKMNVDHVSATPVGMQVRIETELTEIDRKRLVFKVEAYDEAGLIGQGLHERFIIQNEKFLAKAESKLEK